MGFGFFNCTPGTKCQGPNNTWFGASMNNVSSVLPNRVSLLQAYTQKSHSIYTPDFPPGPPLQFDSTCNVPRGLGQPVKGTRLYKLKFGSCVQIILQDTSIFSTEDHPVHLHGYHFYIVGQGFGVLIRHEILLTLILLIHHKGIQSMLQLEDGVPSD
ncbi:laccase [Artemisia annua]|uniref:Laccase n=1 Tax=Artemisia annua TaxID=35608 RepID=A0A2U1NTZ6_ARTAN|nr:laccase [Artemisia annua]